MLKKVENDYEQMSLVSLQIDDKMMIKLESDNIRHSVPTNVLVSVSIGFRVSPIEFKVQINMSNHNMMQHRQYRVRPPPADGGGVTGAKYA